MQIAAPEAPAPRGLEAAAVAHHYRRSGGTQLTVLEVDTAAWRITLGNFPGVRVSYRWTMRSDTGGFRFVEVEEPAS
jgi:hypothetical protein